MTTTDHSGTRAAPSASRRVRGLSGARVVLGAGSQGSASGVVAKVARTTAVLAESFAALPSAVRDPQRQEVASRACARYAEVAATQSERARYARRATKYAALARHLRWVSAPTGCTLMQLHAGPSCLARLHNARTEAAARGTRLSDPTRGEDRQPPPWSASPHLRACMLLAAPGAPDRGTGGYCCVSLDRPPGAPCCSTHRPQDAPPR